MNPPHLIRWAALVLATQSAAGLAQTAAVAPAAPASAASAPAGPTVRPEVGLPLQAVIELIKAKDGKAALAKLAEIEAVPALTPYETYAIARYKAIAASEAGQTALGLASFEVALAASFLPAADRQPLIVSAARLALLAKDYPQALKWLVRYKDIGGTDDVLRRLLPQVLAETNDHAGAIRETLVLMQADQAAGRKTAENLLRNLAVSQNTLGDSAGYMQTLERLALNYPKTDYWAELISRAERKPGFDGVRLRLDVFRLMRAAGVELDAAELTDMALRALQSGLPAEAQALLDEGFTAGLLGKGKDAAEQAKLRDQATKAAALDRVGVSDSEKSALANKDGNAAVNLGFALSGAGAHASAVPLMEQGLAKGGLRRPEEAQLHLGVAQWRAGRLDDAARSFAAVKGAEGTAELAKVWALWLASAKKP